MHKINALVAQLVEHLTLNQGVQGSTPCRRTKQQKNDALVAQLVEHLTLNQGVQGSTPCRRTKVGSFFESFQLLFYIKTFYINIIKAVLYKQQNLFYTSNKKTKTDGANHI